MSLFLRKYIPKSKLHQPSAYCVTASLVWDSVIPFNKLQEIASKDESGKLFEASEEEAYLHILIKSKSYWMICVLEHPMSALLFLSSFFRQTRNCFSPKKPLTRARALTYCGMEEVLKNGMLKQWSRKTFFWHQSNWLEHLGWLFEREARLNPRLPSVLSLVFTYHKWNLGKLVFQKGKQDQANW